MPNTQKLHAYYTISSIAADDNFFDKIWIIF